MTLSAAQNQGGNLGLRVCIYCFETTAAAGADAKDGTDDG
jgi:hypothetical protein